MNRLVFDSDQGRTCQKCSRPIGLCSCSEAKAPESDGIVRVRREVRRGKPVTVAFGIPLADEPLRKLAKQLKRRCGGGGKSGNGELELQGDHRDVIIAELTALGYTVKRAGG